VDQAKHRVCSTTTAAGRRPATLSSGRGRAQTANAGYGRIRGKEVLDTTIQTPVTGLVILSRVEKRTWQRTVRVRRGVFWVRVRPGRYRLTGEDGGAECKGVEVTVRTRHTARVTITCDGM
jgi:hypothetical protein